MKAKFVLLRQFFTLKFSVKNDCTHELCEVRFSDSIEKNQSSLFALYSVCKLVFHEFRQQVALTAVSLILKLETASSESN